MSTEEGQTLGEKLRASRTDRGLSLREVERRSGINTGYLSQLERNEIANPTPSVLQKVAKAYEEPFQVLMRWAGYIEDDPDGTSPNFRRALDVLGDDFTDEELKAIRAVLDAIRGRNRATFAEPHRTDIELGVEEHTTLRKHALAVLRELDALDTPERVDMDEVLLVAKLVKAGAIELTLEEKKRLRKRFHNLVDMAVAALQGIVHLDSGEVYLNPELDRWEQRKRFVMGHEVAHAVLEDHRVTFAHLDDRARLSQDFADRLERQANQFSIELLAKGDRLRQEFDDSPPNISEIERLSVQYGISRQATARRLAEESQHPCAVAIAYRSHKGEGDLLVDRYKLWTSESFEERLAWQSRDAPHADIRTALLMTAAGGVLPPQTHADADGRPVHVTVEGMDIHFAVFALLSCPPRPRLRRVNPFLRARSA
jgi:Zn-dependent peptidase ImmA (M78 family)/transcriptional regulator with XRE-family HTH domain